MKFKFKHKGDYMIRKPVISSNINSVGYENQTLEVEFNSGGIYQYYNVPSYIHSGLMSASSHGKYLHRNVKGTYSYKRIS
jgi:hypothetical protein